MSLKNMPCDVLIGMGQIGTGLAAVLRETPSDIELKTYDREAAKMEWDGTPVRFLHICINWNEDFVASVNNYIRKFRPQITVNHSTVPVGTTRLLFGRSVHSPVRGQHPDLRGGIRTFVKYVSGEEEASVLAVVDALRLAKIDAKSMPNGPESTEVAKLMCTFRYGLNIAAAQEVNRLCEKFKIKFEDVYSDWERSYNQGYELLGKLNVRRPVLFPGVIAGHCVMPNIEIIRLQHDSLLFDAIIASNEKQKLCDSKK